MSDDMIKDDGTMAEEGTEMSATAMHAIEAEAGVDTSDEMETLDEEVDAGVQATDTEEEGESM